MTDLHERAAALLAAEGPYYAERDPIALGEHYFRHVNAMTGESLHSKADIAEQLAYRDALIRELLAENFTLAAGCCPLGYGDEGGTPRCCAERELERLRARVAELEQIRDLASREVNRLVETNNLRDAGPSPFQGRTTHRD